MGTFVHPEQLKNSTFSSKDFDGKPIVEDTIQIIIRLNIMPVFDWMEWKKGYEILEDNSFDYSKLETLTLCKLLTFIFRTDRYNANYLYERFLDRSMVKILDQLAAAIKKEFF